MPFGRVSPPYWDNRTVYLVGGGPSLFGFPFELLRGQTVVAVNDAVFKLPFTATAVVSVDSQWIAKRSLADFSGEAYIGVSSEDQAPAWPCTLLQWESDAGLSTDPAVIRSPSTSGYAALNLAFLKQAKRIVLLGYDYRRAGEHWFGNYPWSSGADYGLWKLWAQMYYSTIGALVGADVEMLNANPNSAITAFEQIPLGSVIDELTRARQTT